MNRIALMLAVSVFMAFPASGKATFIQPDWVSQDGTNPDGSSVFGTEIITVSGNTTQTAVKMHISSWLVNKGYLGSDLAFWGKLEPEGNITENSNIQIIGFDAMGGRNINPFATTWGGFAVDSSVTGSGSMVFYISKASNSYTIYQTFLSDHNNAYWQTSSKYDLSHFCVVSVESAQTAVPEPSTIILFGTGLVVAAGMRKRKPGNRHSFG